MVWKMYDFGSIVCPDEMEYRIYKSHKWKISGKYQQKERHEHYTQAMEKVRIG